MAEGEVRRVPLPAGAGRPYQVYVNGEERAEGEGFTVEDGFLAFSVPLRPRPRLGIARKVMLAIGIGVYGDLRGDTLDLRYHAGGEARVTSISLSRAAGGLPPPT